MEFNFLGIVNRVLAMTGKALVTTLSTTTNKDDYSVQLCVNDTLQDLSNLLRIKSRMINFSFNTVAAQRVYPIPKQAKIPIYDLRQKQTGVKLGFIETNVYDEKVPNDVSSGDPLLYYIENAGGVQYQPASSGETINIVSSNSADTVKTIIQGYDTSGNYISEEVTLNGTSSVASTNTYKTVEKISKQVTSGIVTYSTATITTVLKLGPRETQSSILQIGLYPIPSSVITIYGRAWAKIPSLVYDYDSPIGIGEDCINAIVAGAYARFMKFDPKYTQENIQSIWNVYSNEVMKIIDNDMRNPDRVVRMRSSREITSQIDWSRPINRHTS